MPRVRMLTSVAGFRHDALIEGETYVVTGDEARDFVVNGAAELVEPEQRTTPERRRRAGLETR